MMQSDLWYHLNHFRLYRENEAVWMCNCDDTMCGSMMQTQDGIVSTGSYPRDNLKRTQTPQGFLLEKFAIYIDGH